MTAPCFVDANVFVYAIDPRDPVKLTRAQEWIDWLWRQRAGRTSFHVLTEFYAVVTRKLRPTVGADFAWDHVTRYFAWAPQATDEPLLRRAREIEARYKLSWWDSMVVAAAQLQDCAILATEDMQDGAVYGSVTVRNPFTSVLEEPPAEYAVSAVPLHRPRGRPRRLAAA